MEQDLNAFLATLRWHGHDTFEIAATPPIWFDPWKLGHRREPAALVLVSHDHFDHCSPPDVDLLRGPSTVVLASVPATARLPGARGMKPGDSVTVQGVTVEAVHAYNVNKFRSPGQLFHPREAGGVGWILTLGDLRVYFAGDTDHIPEMRSYRCDVALLPVSGTYVMTADEALAAARTIGPRVVVPMHFGDIVGYENDGAMFAASWSGHTHLPRCERKE
jgi:L-ascorbate metabolism protein UlaG (beta-lactamase superfamily)